MIRRVITWAETHTSRGRYSPVGQAFHWLVACLILPLLWLGWYMGRIPSGAEKTSAFQLHMIVGLTTLVLAVLRLSWRMTVRGPVNDADKLGFQTVLAKLTHIVFYACFIGLPLSGWLMWSAFAGSERLDILGLLEIPPFPFEALDFAAQRTLLHGANRVHEALVITLLIIIPAHVGAALKHHFWDRHDVLTAMLPVLQGDQNLAGKTRKPQQRKSRSRKVRGQLKA
jgi:cytochrome b561